jgi:hypothetical protein
MYYIYIKNKNFVHQVGNQPRLFYNARSTTHQDSAVQINIRAVKRTGRFLSSSYFDSPLLRIEAY